MGLQLDCQSLVMAGLYRGPWGKPTGEHKKIKRHCIASGKLTIAMKLHHFLLGTLTGNAMAMFNSHVELPDGK